jgi:hypothetical protein
VRAGTLAARPFADWAEAAREIHVVVRAGGRPAVPVQAFTALLQQHYRGGPATSRGWAVGADQAPISPKSEAT